MTRAHRCTLAALAAVVARGAAGTVAIAACTSSSAGTAEAPPQPADTSSSPGPAAPGCRQEGPRYLAFLASGACHDVAGSGGTWLAHPLFPEAPAPIRDTACAYQWWAASTASADIAILTTIGAEHLTRDVEVTTRCAARVLSPGSATVLPPNVGDGGESSPTGVSGCDVCARLFGKSLFVILPPDQLDLETAVVLTPSGRYIAFGMSVPAGTQAFAVELPANALESYKEGRVPLFRAPH